VIKITTVGKDSATLSLSMLSSYEYVPLLGLGIRYVRSLLHSSLRDGRRCGGHKRDTFAYLRSGARFRRENV
jgi:hypothetical protein